MATEIKDFPEEIVNPIKSLNDVTRRRIFLALTENDESYSQIRERFNLKKGTLTYHLHNLVGSGLIRNYTERLPESRHNSYYELTDFGHRFIEGLYYTLAPRPKRRTYTLNSITVSDDYLDGGSAVAPRARFEEMAPKIICEE